MAASGSAEGNWTFESDSNRLSVIESYLSKAEDWFSVSESLLPENWLSVDVNCVAVESKLSDGENWLNVDENWLFLDES